ncbi:MAG: PaaI family thioesterase [Proteobacteria bacterium]|nr:PaaI family thioesterase [Desulfobacula sp.]MBU3951181.1 PaaI family thioesterase [Pseudomonadota bacterium]MBU4130715.1 PaaI family thioesterase [Pseudomonadota bacterium]
MTIEFVPEDENYREKVAKSFDRQRAMKTIGITLEEISPGRVVLNMPYNEAYTQQHGFVHAGILSTALDSACGYAAFSLMPEEAAVLSIEYKVNLLAPAKGEKFIITGQVLKAGRTLTVCQSEAYAVSEGKKKLVAQMTGTMMTIIGRKGINQ